MVFFYAIISFMKNLATVYEGHAEIPQVPEQYLEEILAKPIAKRQMERTEEGLLPGHIILLWRIQFGSYTNQSPHHKYFATTYGIDAQQEVEWLIDEDYVVLEDVRIALRHIPATQLKNWLKEKEVKGLSKMKRADLDQAIFAHFSDEELADRYQVRAYLLTTKGEETLAKHPEIVAKHPQKKY